MDALETDVAVNDESSEETEPSSGVSSEERTTPGGIAKKLESSKEFFRRHKKLLFLTYLPVFMVLLLLAGYRLFSTTEEQVTRDQEPLKILAQKADQNVRNGMVKQNMQPFYVELTEKGAGSMARLSFSITSDASSAKRFEENKVLVRDRLYKSLIELASEGKDMRTMSLTVRSEAQKILEEILRPSELRVVVTGIFIV